LTHLPFPNNQIPSNRINPVAAAMLKYMPLPDTNLDNTTANYTRTAQIVDKFSQEYTVKIEHKFTDKVSLSGFYLYNKTDEPCADYFEPGLNGANRFADPGDYILNAAANPRLEQHVGARRQSVLALRFGLTRFPDNNAEYPVRPVDVRVLADLRVADRARQLPRVDIQGYDQAGRTLGAINPTQINYKSTSATPPSSKFVGTHTFKPGGDFRKVAWTR
jgi:hypothetical protein